MQNNGTAQFNAVVALDSTTRLPAGWTVKVTPSKISVPAKGEAIVEVTVNAPAKAAFTGVAIQAYPVANGSVGRGQSTIVYALSDNAKYAVYNFGGAGSAVQYATLQKSETYGNSVVMIPSEGDNIPLNVDIMQKFPASRFDVSYFDVDGLPIDISDSGWPALSLINSALEKGKKVMVAGRNLLYFAFDPTSMYAATGRTVGAQTFFNDLLGVEYVRHQARYSGQYYTPFAIEGSSGDEISKGITATCNTTGSYMQDYTDVMKLRAGSASTPILFFDGNTENIAGVRCQKNDKKLIFMSFNLDAISEPNYLGQLVEHGTRWLLGTTGVEENAKGGEDAMLNATLFPNPAGDITAIRYQIGGSSKQSVAMTVVNMLGQTVVNIAPEIVVPGFYTTNINTSGLYNGQYRVIIRTNDTVVQLPLVIFR